MHELERFFLEILKKSIKVNFSWNLRKTIVNDLVFEPVFEFFLLEIRRLEFDVNEVTF
jgi:hypothetical protein